VGIVSRLRCPHCGQVTTDSRAVFCNLPPPGSDSAADRQYGNPPSTAVAREASPEGRRSVSGSASRAAPRAFGPLRPAGPAPARDWAGRELHRRESPVHAPCGWSTSCARRARRRTCARAAARLPG